MTTTINSIFFVRGAAGTPFYFGSTTRLRSNSLSTAWDITTDGDKSNSPSLTGGPFPGLFVRATGLQAFLVDSTGLTVRRFTLTGGDVTTASDDSDTLDISGETSTPAGLFIKSDGTILYVLDTTLNTIFQYTLSTLWTPSTGSYSGKSFLITDDATVTDFSMNDNGLKLFTLGNTNDKAYEYALTTMDDISTAMLTTSFSVSAQTTTPSKIAFGSSGTKLYVRGAGEFISEYDIPAYSLSSGAGINDTGRNAIVMGELMYVVIGSGFYSIGAGGAAVLLGTVANDNLPVGLATDGTNLVITANTAKYAYTTTGGLETITDSDLGNAYTSAYIDSRFLYDQADGKFTASALRDPTDVNALDFARAESSEDALLSVFTHNQLVYLCGGTTIEVWLSTGVGRPPFQRQNIIQRGLIGRRAISSIDNVVYFLDNSRRPNRMTGMEYATMYSPALGEEFNSYTTVDDCIVNAYSFEQENFVDFTFPTENKTWTYHELSQQWTKREDTSGNRFRTPFYVNAYNKLLGLDHSTGKVYEFSKTAYQDDGSDITRTIDSDIITSELYGAEGLLMIASEFTVTISAESGGGTLSVSFSDNPADLTPTFDTARTFTMVAGTNVIDFHRFGRFREGVFRLTLTSNDKVDLIGVALDSVLLHG